MVLMVLNVYGIGPVIVYQFIMGCILLVCGSYYLYICGWACGLLICQKYLLLKLVICELHWSTFTLPFVVMCFYKKSIWSYLGGELACFTMSIFMMLVGWNWIVRWEIPQYILFLPVELCLVGCSLFVPSVVKREILGIVEVVIYLFTIWIILVSLKLSHLIAWRWFYIFVPLYLICISLYILYNNSENKKTNIKVFFILFTTVVISTTISLEYISVIGWIPASLMWLSGSLFLFAYFQSFNSRENMNEYDLKTLHQLSITN